MRVLIADDDRVTLRMLERLLRNWQYELDTAEDGGVAWEKLSCGNPPDIALLDWRMPALDGIEICRRLRQDHQVYTILVTQHDEGGALSNALDSGADDFVPKPVDPTELRSRLGVAERTVGYWKQLRERNAQLELFATEMKDLAEARAKQLVHAERMATIGMLSAGVAHEINNPATFISGNAQSLQRFWKDVIKWLENAEIPEDDRSKFEFVREEVPKSLAGILNGVSRISVIVKGLKSYARRERGSLGPCQLNQCVENAVELCKHQVRRSGVQVDTEIEEGLPEVTGDCQQLEQIIVNLIVNAAQAVEELKNGRVVVSTRMDGDDVVVSVQDNGTGIPDEVFEHMWDPFFTTKDAEKGTGLGLAIGRDIATDHAGSLTAFNVSGSGACFELKIPEQGVDRFETTGGFDEAAIAGG